ncbi:MAG: hypothetical protein CMF22_11225 [Idiomarinaceae bacterium]|nr:hypothetical protein [Idiomarinaceae bacterium]|tara:strand:+ start:142524 stop:143153 length:630 start_codon:yes stop_codon:yes gene_type:complete
MSDQIKEQVREQIKHQLNEGQKEALCEGMFQRLLAKGTDKYQFKFLENKQQDTRYAFIKDDRGNIHWHMFIGKRMMDSGSFMNDMEILAFVDEKTQEGFKEVNRQGNIAGFFKAIGRGLGMLLQVHGFTAFMGAFIAMMFVVLDPSFVNAIFGHGAATAIGSMYGTAAVGSLAVLGTGWIVTKMSQSQTQPDTSNVTPTATEETPPASV